ALLQLIQVQNISQTGNTIQAPALVDNLVLASEIDLLTSDIPKADPEASLEIKNNKKIRSKLVPKTDKEWFDLIESNISEPSNPEPQAYYFLDLDIKQNSIQYAKDMFKVDEAKYAFSIWFIDTKEHKLEAGMTEDEYLIRVKFIQVDTIISNKETKRGFKIIDKYEPICESKRKNGKYIKGGSNVILTKKTKPSFWVRIDEKFLVREVSRQSEVEKLNSNAVIYGLYRIQVPDINQLMPIKDETLNCVAQQIIEHFDQAKREYEFTETCWQKIDIWEKKMRIPGTRVQDVAELEKILK
ncbi:16348_t:CDS:2, partial [Cetraspora pellucida]